MQNFSDLVQGEHFNIRVEWGVRKKCALFIMFNVRITGYISETVRDTAKVTINY